MNFLLNLLIPMHVAHPYIRNHFCSMHPCGFPRLQSNLQASEGEQFYCNLQASEEEPLRNAERAAAQASSCWVL